MSAMTDVEFWRLYREERQKIAPKKGRRTPARAITSAEVVQCARRAQKRLEANAAVPRRALRAPTKPEGGAA